MNLFNILYNTVLTGILDIIKGTSVIISYTHLPNILTKSHGLCPQQAVTVKVLRYINNAPWLHNPLASECTLTSLALAL